MTDFISYIRDILWESSYFGVALTLGLYLAFTFLRGKIHRPLLNLLLNPLLLTIASIILFLVLTGIPYEAYETSGIRITWFLTPATVCFAVPLYRQIQVLKRHAAAIFISILAGSLTSVASIFLMSKVVGLPFSLYASLAPKSVTTPIATGISQEMGGVVGCTVVAVILTGILGSIFATGLKKIFRIHSDIAWGLATGTSSHAIGTSSVMGQSEVAGAMGSLSIALAGMMTVVIVPLLSSLY